MILLKPREVLSKKGVVNPSKLGLAITRTLGTFGIASWKLGGVEDSTVGQGVSEGRESEAK